MASNQEIKKMLNTSYDAGFVTDIEDDQLPVGLNEDTIRGISAKKNEPDFLLQWRLKAYQHWLTMSMPNWAQLSIDPINFQDICYYLNQT